MAKSVEIHLKVNGKNHVGHCESRTLLADFLRDHLNLTGTHTGCEHGVCGVCTIFVNGEAVRSCIMLAAQANGAEIVTIEGLSTAGRYHAVQKAFHENHALQCGFCTPGMLVADRAGGQGSAFRGAVSLHGLSEHRQGGHGSGGGHARRHGRSVG